MLLFRKCRPSPRLFPPLIMCHINTTNSSKTSETISMSYRDRSQRNYSFWTHILDSQLPNCQGILFLMDCKNKLPTCCSHFSHLLLFNQGVLSGWQVVVRSSQDGPSTFVSFLSANQDVDVHKSICCFQRTR